MLDAVTQQRRCRHYGVGSDQQELDHLIGAVDAGARRKCGIDIAGQNADP